MLSNMEAQNEWKKKSKSISEKQTLWLSFQDLAMTTSVVFNLNYYHPFSCPQMTVVLSTW